MSKQSLQSILKFIESQAGCDLAIASAAQDGLKAIDKLDEGSSSSLTEFKKKFETIKKISDPDTAYIQADELCDELNELFGEVEEFSEEVDQWKEDIEFEEDGDEY